jgi:hypothetical protein
MVLTRAAATSPPLQHPADSGAIFLDDACKSITSPNVSIFLISHRRTRYPLKRTVYACQLIPRLFACKSVKHFMLPFSLMPTTDVLQLRPPWLLFGRTWCSSMTPHYTGDSPSLYLSLARKQRGPDQPADLSRTPKMQCKVRIHRFLLPPLRWRMDQVWKKH